MEILRHAHPIKNCLGQCLHSRWSVSAETNPLTQTTLSAHIKHLILPTPKLNQEKNNSEKE